jgi:predicted DNA-binding helix-hairpin-helix protein
MDRFKKLALVALSSEHESDGEPSRPWHSTLAASTNCQLSFASENTPVTPTYKYILANGHSIPIHMAAAPGGKRIPLLKAMLTTACEMNCRYCAFTSRRNYRRITFKPQELAEAFISIHQKGWVEGIFLSTGIFNGGVYTQDRLLETAEILRKTLGYRGYLHLKIMPGSEKDQLLQAMRLADRVSVNLEATSEMRLAKLAPRKQFQEQLLQPLKWMQEIRTHVPAASAWNGRWPSSSTQFVVGPAGESDLELISLTASLTKVWDLKRTYFEAFKPVPGTPLENHSPEDPLRQHRLYQAAFLLRDYDFDLEDFSFSQEGNLPLEMDPKQAYAQSNLKCSPIDLNTAEVKDLLRIPGIGPAGAKSILHARKLSKLKDISQLKRLGILADRAAPYIVLDGKRPAQQLELL